MKLNTRDTIELDHFKSLSSSWWDEKGAFQLLHAITPLRIAFLKEKVGAHFCLPEDSLKIFKGLRVLDVGCGGGLLCEPLARLGADVTGIDALQENIDEAKTHAEAMKLNITYMSCAIENLPAALPPFDVVVASEVIEHVVDPDGFLKACVERLDPRGGIAVTTFNKTLKSYLFGIIAAEYILGWAPRGTHSWDKFISPEKLSQKLSSLNFDHQEFTGLCFSPLSRRWRLAPSLEINYFLWATRF